MKIVSFSGIDGAGKSTQISALEAWLNSRGLQTKLLAFWEDVVCLAPYREFMSYKAFKGDRGVGSPEKPLHRRDKNVSSWPLTLMRLCLYSLDAVSVCLKVRQVRKSGADVVIFDRYIYDELANLPLTRTPARLFARVILGLVPKPDIAYVIDADPVEAQLRKPEYPLEFVRRNREAYIRLAAFSGAMTVVGPDSIQAMKTRIENEVLQTLARSDSHGEPDIPPFPLQTQPTSPPANSSNHDCPRVIAQHESIHRSTTSGRRENESLFGNNLPT